MEALTRELGVAGMVEFMQQFSAGYGDYTKDRRKRTEQLSVNDVWNEMNNGAKQGKPLK